ncbi:MAG: tRNA (5-methylaminomethyl-2-thiouridine)(34)-methyltransferase MnmD, partial [Bacteroidales bacterium]|nr:tRNA (5-methylaminomethyl-2-thiouridine)(34)-methyltransferase MnmD [Bacteroidales bacterium]
MTHPPDRITSASLEWRDGQPLSTAFGDVYYSLDNGLAETRHVFLDGNDLPARWASLANDSDFVIIETGFGSGLNFLAAASLWLATAPPDARLHFVSCEKFPLRRSDLLQALAAWPELAALAGELGDAYPPLVPGFHRRWLGGGRIALTLIFDDAIRGLESLAASDHPAFALACGAGADAWFLDGFAPAKNPDLWSPPLFALAARLSRPGATVATFTVARQVRDGLHDAGFTFAKAPGFGRKRDMLKGTFAGTSVGAGIATDIATGGSVGAGAGESPPVEDGLRRRDAPLRTRRTARSDNPWYLPPPAHRGDKRALVVGGGIAGCASAAALLRRGWRVTIVDRHGQLGAEASGNPQGILYPRLSVEDLALSELGRQALCHAVDYYRPLWQQSGMGQRSGVLVLPESARDREHFPRIAERYREAGELVRLAVGDELAALAGVSL